VTRVAASSRGGAATRARSEIEENNRNDIRHIKRSGD